MSKGRQSEGMCVIDEWQNLQAESILIKSALSGDKEDKKFPSSAWTLLRNDTDLRSFRMMAREILAKTLMKVLDLHI